MFIAYAQKPPVNVHAGVSSGNMFNCYLGVYLHPYFVKLAVKAMARMRICAGSPEPSLLGYMICAKIS